MVKRGPRQRILPIILQCFKMNYLHEFTIKAQDKQKIPLQAATCLKSTVES